MSLQTWQETLITSSVDGTALTAAAAASCLPAAAKYTLPANFFSVGKVLLVRASGRISCAVTTPGTARFDLRLGGTVVFDSLAMGLNIVSKTNVAWYLEMLLTCRAIGATANLIGISRFESEAVVGSPLPSVGGHGVIHGPVSTAPAVGGNFDSTAQQQVDMFFTQTVATGSLTCHQFGLAPEN